MSLDFSLTQNADSAHYTDSSSLSDAPDEHFKIDATLCEFSIIQQNLIALLIGSLWPWEGVMAGFFKIHHLRIISCESLNIQAEERTGHRGPHRSASLSILSPRHHFLVFF